MIALHVAATLLLFFAGGMPLGTPQTSSMREWLNKDEPGPDNSTEGVEASLEVADEEPLPAEPEEYAAREAKARRYNTGRKDLTRLSPGSEVFGETIWPRATPVIPLSESAVALLGTVSKVQPYLSEDRSFIYTEISVSVEEVFKDESEIRLKPAERAILDTPGGRLRLRSGQIVKYPVTECNVGKPKLGARYVFFADRFHQGRDLHLFKAYELREGKVLMLGAGDEEDIPKALQAEQTFLETIRTTASKK